MDNIDKTDDGWSYESYESVNMECCHWTEPLPFSD